jgi:adenylate kinase
MYVLVGLPGVGKYTVAASLERQLAAHDQVVRLVDNHYTCNPVFGLVAEDGTTPLPPAVWDRVREVREVVVQTIETLSPAEWSFIFTHVIDRPGDQQWVERLGRLAETRGSRFIVVRLLCDVDELLRRVVTPSRRERMKSVSAEDARRAFERGVPELAKWDPLTIDVTHRAAADTAKFILRHSAAG